MLNPVSGARDHDTLDIALAASDGIGKTVETVEYIADSGVGGALYKVVASGTGTPDGGSFINKTDGSGNQLELQPIEGKVFATQWGTVADGTTSSGTDNGPLINAAIAYARANLATANIVILPQGPLSIEEPIKWLQGVDVFGYGTHAGALGGTELICNYSAGTISTPPTDNYKDRYSPVFAFTPMFYNTELVTQQNYGNFRLNGNDKDVYGLYINEFFFSESIPIFVINCNKYPVTMLVGQQVSINHLTSNNCKQGLRFVGMDSLDMKLDTESNTITGSQLDFIQDANFSNKSGNVISTWHFEETATEFPTIFAKISGRNLHILTSSFGTSSTPSERFIETLGSEAYSFDGVNITTTPSVGTRILGISASASSSLGFQFNSGTTGTYVRSASGTTVTDNSGNVTNQVDSITKAQQLPRGTVIKGSTGADLMFFSSDSKINFFGNANRYLEQSGANFNIKNDAGSISLESTASMNIQGSLVDIDAAGGVNAGRFDDDTTAGNTRLLVYDVDNGTLERVSVGVADSGGSGFKLLRIIN